ncbi:MAG: hypothetical protein K2F79_02260, partial [Muribaculaceae bacterium]|nr:hypothetical protein [Muribaculaceae bacterium]
HELALSTSLQPGSIPSLPLDYSSALAYLRGEALTDLPDGLPRGHVAVTYGGLPLGLVKNIGRRANNLYPDAQRLRIDPRGAAEPRLPLVYV